MNTWVKEFPGGVTVCDAEGIILEMNDKARMIFSKDGGASLIGKNVFDCHPQHAKDKLSAMMKEGRMNAYTIEKNGIKKIASCIEKGCHVHGFFFHGAHIFYVDQQAKHP